MKWYAVTRYPVTGGFADAAAVTWCAGPSDAEPDHGHWSSLHAPRTRTFKRGSAVQGSHADHRRRRFRKTKPNCTRAGGQARIRPWSLGLSLFHHRHSFRRNAVIVSAHIVAAVVVVFCARFYGNITSYYSYIGSVKNILGWAGQVLSSFEQRDSRESVYVII
jgi:hypothetical protein